MITYKLIEETIETQGIVTLPSKDTIMLASIYVDDILHVTGIPIPKDKTADEVVKEYMVEYIKSHPAVPSKDIDTAKISMEVTDGDSIK